VYNSIAFELAGVTLDTPDPTGGHFYRENGELTGKVAERARAVFNGVGKREEVSRKMRQAGIAFISEAMTSAGLTSVHHTGGGRTSLMALQDAYHAGEMKFRMYFFPSRGLYRQLEETGIRTGFGDAWLRIGAVKYGTDGSASERTMRMSTPYVGRPDDYGILTMTQDEIHEVVEGTHRAGWQIGIHANGDVAIDMVLNAYERVQREWPRTDPRHRIEHCTLINPDLIRRIKAIEAVPTPFYTYVYYHGDKWAEYGEEKLRNMFAHRSFLDAGIPVASASDYMPGPYEPMMALQSMVTRTDFRGNAWGLNQRVTVDEALRICTLNGAYASREEQVKGSITAGKLADFVILSRDPHAVDPSTLKDIPVVRTVVGGVTVHEA
jgi:predicted amidohydrolase YtcJ